MSPRLFIAAHPTGQGFVLPARLRATTKVLTLKKSIHQSTRKHQIVTTLRTTPLMAMAGTVQGQSVSGRMAELKQSGR